MTLIWQGTWFLLNYAHPSEEHLFDITPTKEHTQSILRANNFDNPLK